MSDRRRFLTIWATVLVLCSLLNHATARLLNIRTSGIDRGRIGAGADAALVLGSSIGFFGISFERVSRAINLPLVTRSIGGCSPSELEVLAREVPRRERLFVAISLFDMNENSICDSRALVPFLQTVRDLRVSRAPWPEVKRALWTYPIPSLQAMFPLVGRSNAVLVGVRDATRRLSGRATEQTSEPRLTFKTDEETSRPERLSDWDDGRVARNLSQLVAAGVATGRIGGPKMLALNRLLEGPTPSVVLVMPMSPPYRAAFGAVTATEALENSLVALQARHATATVIRLDLAPELQDAQVYWDLVHLNDAGRRIATNLVLEQLVRSPKR